MDSVNGDSEHTNCSKKISNASDQTKATAVQVTDGYGKAGSGLASSAPIPLAVNDDCFSGATARSEKLMGDNGHRPGQKSGGIEQQNDPKKAPKTNEIEDKKTFLMRMEALEMRNRELEKRLQEHEMRQQADEAKYQALKAENRELFSKLEPHENVQTSPCRIMRISEPDSANVVNVAAADKKAFKEKCHNTCQVSGIKGRNICAHIWPKHFENGLKSIFGDKYSIHGESKLALLH